MSITWIVMYQTDFGLNPCFNGICSMRPLSLAVALTKRRLNPCFNGICSMSAYVMRGLKRDLQS